MYKCLECGKIFEEPKKKRICFEVEYGVANLFPDCHDIETLVCPYCEEMLYEEIDEEEEEE